MNKVCYHCGSKHGSFVEYKNKDFCCNGCLTVYNILNDNKLYTYYDLANTPGIQGKEDGLKSDYAYLEQEEIKRSILDFYDEKIGKIRVYIPSIHCSSCIWLLENLHRLNKGIIHSSVNFTKKEVLISFNEEYIKLSEVFELLESIHYKPIIRDKKQHNTAGANKPLLIKLGIAGFAFGNVMLLSFPDYLSHTITIADHYIQYFGWVSLFLSLPVLVYSASDYYLTAWKNIVKGLISIDLPIAIGISTIFLRSIIELIGHSGTGYFDSLTGLIFFLLIGRWYQDKTYRALNFENDYTSYFPLAITRFTDKGEELIPIKNLKIGDRIAVRNNEIIPADSILQSAFANIDYSFITGESIPVKKEKGEKIFAGGRQLGETVECLVEKDVETSYLAELWKERARPEEFQTFISGTLDKVSKYFTISILGVSAITALYWFFVNPSLIVITFTSVLIVACPCALALSAPFTFGHAQSILGRNGLFLKHSSVVENLSNINTVVFDKTGTLTDASSFEVILDPQLGKSAHLGAIKSLTSHSFHPLSRAIFAQLTDEPKVSIKNFQEKAGLGLSGNTDQHEFKLGSSDFIGGKLSEISDNSSRVFANVDGQSIGFFKIRNHYRTNWENLLTILSSKYNFHLLSGDNDNELSTIAKIVGTDKHLNFNQSPRQKLNYVLKLKNRGENVLMLGDGLNDSGALSESNVGISVADDIYQFSPASDAIIRADSLIQISRFLEFAKATRKVMWTSFIFSFLYNAVGIWFAASGKLSPLIAAILMPLSSVTIVVIATFLTHYYGRKMRL